MKLLYTTNLRVYPGESEGLNKQLLCSIIRAN